MDFVSYTGLTFWIWKRSQAVSLNLSHSLEWGDAKPAVEKHGEMAQRVKVLVPKPNNVCLIPATHMVEGRKQFLEAILWPLHACAHMYWIACSLCMLVHTCTGQHVASACVCTRVLDSTVTKK